MGLAGRGRPAAVNLAYRDVSQLADACHPECPAG
jgi:hypothetical protein